MPGPVLKSNTLVMPKFFSGSDGNVNVQVEWSVGVQIPFACVDRRIAAGDVVLSAAGANNTVGPTIVSNITAVRERRIAGSNSTTTATTANTVFGVATQDVELGDMGIAAGVGSVVMVNCEDVATDPDIATAGTWVVASNATNGKVISAIQADIVAGTYDGLVVGRVIVGAGTGANKSGSDTQCCILIQTY